MRIGFITSEYPHPKVQQAAGIGTSIKSLALVLAKKGVEVTIFIYNQNEHAVINDEGVELHLIKKKRFKMFTWYYYRKHIQHYVNNVVNQKAIDLLEAPDWTGITAFMKFKVPLIIRFHGSDAYFCKLDRRKQKYKNFLFEKLAIKTATAYIAPTEFAGHETSKIFGIDENKIKTIHYGLQLDKFINSSPDTYHKNTILYIGTIIRKKGVLELAEIFNKVIEERPDTKLKIIGSDAPDILTGGSSTYKLMEAIFSTAAKKQVQYLGKIPYNDVKTHIKNAHLCTFPSFAETLGMVTIESMALHKPVVNTSIGWAKELIDDKINGLLVHPSDIATYAKQILVLLNNEDLCIKIGTAARKKVEDRFDIHKNAAINMDYYKTFIKK